MKFDYFTKERAKPKINPTNERVNLRNASPKKQRNIPTTMSNIMLIHLLSFKKFQILDKSTVGQPD